MHSQIPVDSSTPNADKHADVPGGPSWPYEDGDRTIKYKLWECPSPSVLLSLSSNISAKIKWERLYCNHLYIDFIHFYGSVFDFQLKRFAELCGDHQSITQAPNLLAGTLNPSPATLSSQFLAYRSVFWLWLASCRHGIYMELGNVQTQDRLWCLMRAKMHATVRCYLYEEHHQQSAGKARHSLPSLDLTPTGEDTVKVRGLDSAFS